MRNKIKVPNIFWNCRINVNLEISAKIQSVLVKPPGQQRDRYLRVDSRWRLLLQRQSLKLKLIGERRRVWNAPGKVRLENRRQRNFCGHYRCIQSFEHRDMGLYCVISCWLNGYQPYYSHNSTSSTVLPIFFYFYLNCVTLNFNLFRNWRYIGILLRSYPLIYVYRWHQTKRTSPPMKSDLVPSNWIWK